MYTYLVVIKDWTLAWAYSHAPPSLIDYQYYLVETLKWPMYPPREYQDPQTPRKKQQKEKTLPATTPPPPKKKKKKEKRTREKKRKKEGAIFANPPSEDSLVDEPL